MYRIGELSKHSQVSKRTIDYYTKIGLLECDRSRNNYRYYHEDALADLKLIEQCQQMNMTLNEIKDRLMVMKSVEVDPAILKKQVEHIRSEMDHLQNELHEVLLAMENLEDDERKRVLKQVSPQASALFQTLTVFSG
ncbi:MerR family transcriptional regulator (plasmid) [Cytobacillus spongiae]|uniref:MerR family transcriptional regulator n=1 Tax=Cytobacillus spongiae TaxID=2901381 RepID=UPI00145DD4BF|nr:MerR family transcriptional regulator [Cytobacillus spongiae]MCA1062682.1 MerR family transcriptional regulator [Rossellomorea aquimaris]NMH70021.1 MerR family transcriptional regulator [Bacillus sp. RO3]UII58309.1 MerR family transcriptional regulator [Cytobacillus spongiae]WJV28652.1 MerR family transcriptional regulator [Rossellomorea sp. AcN35-11]